MIDTLVLKETLLKELNYVDSPDLKETDLWPNGRDIPYVESAYFVQGVPVVYFSRIEDSTQQPDDIWRLYRSVWSQSKVPLLYVITPQEIRVYNGYAEPVEKPEELIQSDEEHRDRLLQHLQQLVDVETARQKINQSLDDYKRIYLETGAFWNTIDGQKIKRESRADHRLLRSLDHVRGLLLQKLPKDEHSKEIVYALIGRSIFIRYLEDREILQPEWVLEVTDGQADSYLSALENSNTTITYNLFEYLSQRFNGDLFPVDKEEHRRINKDHLGLLHQFLSGKNLETGQLSLWPYAYDFTHIPIELISGIYDTFLSEKKRKKLGAYYTPLPLVDFVVEETLPIEKTHPNTTILDPTCGSGVFLVRAYQRLVEAWKRQHNSFPSSTQLQSILTQHIFGVDIQLNAVKIATFSLYLALLDYLKNDDIKNESFRFPSLQNSNLIHGDFLSKAVEEKFSNRKFDRIIGNLPWGKSQLTDEALQRSQELDHETGGKQLVQPLLQSAPKFCAEGGEIALLASAKATILVTSSTHEKFRRRFLQQYQVRAVVNFSALRHEIFLDSDSPTVAIFYRPLLPSQEDRIAYGVPKPSTLSQKLGAIVLDASEIKFLERNELLNYPALWKIALWGNPRDAAIIKYLQSFPTLMDQAIFYGWTVKVKGKEGIPQGFILGNHRKNEALWLQGMVYVDTDRFKSYVVETHGVVRESIFEKPRTQEIYRGPITLIRRSTCTAAFLEKGEVAYRDKVTGIPGKPGQERLLKWLAAYVNSSLVRYYHFLTSTSWAVERDTIIHEEYKRMPFYIPNEDDPLLNEVLEYFDQIVALSQPANTLLSGKNKGEIQRLQSLIDNLIFKIYNLSPVEYQVILDVIKYVIPFFQWSARKKRTFVEDKAEPVKRPNAEMLMQYARTFIETATSLLRYQDQTLNAVVYQDGAPLDVLEFELVSLEEAREVRFIGASEKLRALLFLLDRRLLERHSSTLYTRRHARIFDGPRFYIIRPAEQHLWTSSQALADADGFLVEILAYSKNAAVEASQ